MPVSTPTHGFFPAMSLWPAQCTTIKAPLAATLYTNKVVGLFVRQFTAISGRHKRLVASVLSAESRAGKRALLVLVG